MKVSDNRVLSFSYKAASMLVCGLCALAITVCIAGCSASDSAGDSSEESESDSNNVVVPSDGTEKTAGSSSEGYSAYYKKCQEYLSLYGAPAVSDMYGTGLCFAKLLDLNADGTDELILAYMATGTSPEGVSDMGVEVWSYQNGEAVNDAVLTFSQHNSNGYFPFIRIAQRNDDEGYSFLIDECHGSGPMAYVYKELGYRDDGTFGNLLSCAFADDYDGNTTYYLLLDDIGCDWLPWTPDEWEEVGEDEYNFAIESFGEDVVHAHLFYEPDFEASLGCENSDAFINLDGTLSQTRETIKFLAEYE